MVFCIQHFLAQWRACASLLPYPRAFLLSVGLVTQSDVRICLRRFWGSCMDRSVEDAYGLVGNCEPMTHDELGNIIVMKRFASARSSAPCRHHRCKRGRGTKRMMCSYRKRVSTHCAGTPCVSYSSMLGRRQSKRRRGDHGALVFLLRVSLRLLCMDKRMLHENFDSFEIQVLERCFQKYYIIETLVLRAYQDFGWPVERIRRYIFMWRKDAYAARVGIRGFMAWNMRLLGSFRRECCSTWRICFVLSSPDEILEEIFWVAARPPSIMHGGIVSMATHFIDCLTMVEQKWVEEYAASVCTHSMVLLFQIPFNMPSVAPRIHGGQVLQTIVRNRPQFYSQGDQRWFCPQELLQGMGWPVLASIYWERCTYRLSRERFGLQCRTRLDTFYKQTME